MFLWPKRLPVCYSSWHIWLCGHKHVRKRCLRLNTQLHAQRPHTMYGRQSIASTDTFCMAQTCQRALAQLHSSPVHISRFDSFIRIAACTVAAGTDSIALLSWADVSYTAVFSQYLPYLLASTIITPRRWIDTINWRNENLCSRMSALSCLG